MLSALRTVAAWCAFAAQVTIVASDVVYWENRVEHGDVVINSGDTIVLRGNNSVNGSLVVPFGSKLVVDPASDSYLTVGSIDLSGEFRVGARDTPYAKKAVFELACNSPLLGPDIRRKAVLVRENGTLALFGSKGTAQSWTRLRETAWAGDTFLAVDVPTGWTVGDEIVVPSTDFDPHQAEKRYIVSITSAGVQIDRPLQFMHYGRITEGVDERAEVGLLTRNILFRGCQETDPNNTPDVGGHMMFLEKFQQVQVQGVEFQNFGQGDQLGRYALHFHLCGQVPSDTFLRANAIHNSNFRAVVIHGTQGVTLERNVAYNITGHAFMLEDGAEWANVIRQNLVVLVKEKLIQVRLGSDSQVALSAFYITNTNNTITDNIVAGVEGTAFWIDTRLEVKGQSYLTGKYYGIRPFKIALGDIRRNVAHAVVTGFRIESPNLDALDYPQQKYSPPYIYTPDEMPVLRDFLVHHSHQGGWFRSYRIKLDNWIVGDVTEGVQVLSRGDTSTDAIETYVTNSLFVGGTANRGNLVLSKWQFVNYLENRSDSAVNRADDERMGIKLYDGPMYITNTTFRLWYSQPCLNVTNPAMGTRLYNTFLMSTAIVASDVVFEKTDIKFHVSDRDGDGGISTSLVDTIGAISGRAGATLLPQWDFYTTPNCAASVAFDLACPQRYVNLDVVSVDPNTDPTRYGKLTIFRNNVETQASPAPSLSFDGQYIPASNGWLYHPIISPGATYTLQFDRHTPDVLRMTFSYTKAGDVLKLMVTYPTGTQITTVTNQDGASLSKMTSRNDVSACVNCFWYDASRGVLAITVQERAGPAGPSTSCSPLGCLSVLVKAVVSGTSGVSSAQIGSILPLVAVTDDKSPWRQQNFALEAAVLDQADNTKWCDVADPCLHAIDEGNAKMGVLAFYQSPCVGVGCFSNTCRYCKLTFSAAKVSFPGCPFDPNYVAPTTVANPCSDFASVGNSAAGVEVIQDSSCVNGGGVNGKGCINDQCRFCKTKETSLSTQYLNCSKFATATMAPSSTPVTPPTSMSSVLSTPTMPLSPASSNCQQVISVGDSNAGISAIADPICQFGGVGCFSAQCRYCKTRDTLLSTHFVACSQSTGSTTAAPTTSPSPDPCWLAVSPGDAAAGLTAVLDASCRLGGLGCLSSSCRFCSLRVTPQSTPYLPCSSIASATPARPVATVVQQDPCTLLVSSGDVAAGITAVTQPYCGSRGGVGCVTDTCRYCKTRSTPQSAHLLDCAPLMSSSRRLQDTGSRDGSHAVVSIDVCTHAVSIEENVASIFGLTDPRCDAASDHKPSGCFGDSCRYCRTADAIDLFLDDHKETAGQSVADLELCPEFVVASSIGGGDITREKGSSITTPECAAIISFGTGQQGISAIADPSCATSSDSGCLVRAACRYCHYISSPSGSETIASDFPPCEPSNAPVVAISARLASVDSGAEERTHRGRIHSWPPIIAAVVGAACAVAAAAVLVHQRTHNRNRPQGPVRVATPRSLPRRSRGARVDVATLAHGDTTADFFVL